MNLTNYLSLCFSTILAYCISEIGARETILNGAVASPNSFQYQVAITVYNRKPRCGGGILNEHYVITAAHCLIAMHNELLISHNICVLAGTRDVSMRNYTGLIAYVERVYVPDEYEASHSINSIGDVAVLRLRTPLAMNNTNWKKLQFLKNKKLNFQNRLITIAGFGWDKMDETNPLLGRHSDYQLRWTYVSLISNAECQHDHPLRTITDKHICAKAIQNAVGGQPRGACIGDQGGPLVILHRGQSVAVGILSMAQIGCSEITGSAIYTRVTHYATFITNAMNNNVTRTMRVLDV